MIEEKALVLKAELQRAFNRFASDVNKSLSLFNASCSDDVFDTEEVDVELRDVFDDFAEEMIEERLEELLAIEEVKHAS